MRKRTKQHEMDLNDLLRAKGIDPRKVLALRHRPPEPTLKEALPRLAAEEPTLFNAYQQTQGPALERAMKKMVGPGYVASFVGQEPGSALFVGVYSISGARPLTYEQFWRVPDLKRLRGKYGMIGWSADKPHGGTTTWFDLILTDVYAPWKGRLVIQWPPPELSWWRRAHQNDMPVLALFAESGLTVMPEWSQIDLSWDALRTLPANWKTVLSQWRGIYYIFDSSDGKGYVGSAYGKRNLLGRWRSYATCGHGGNRLLRGRDPKNFRFSILQLVSQDTKPDDVIRIESSWKQRLHTRSPLGLNDN
jgi:hypothetical protein